MSPDPAVPSPVPPDIDLRLRQLDLAGRFGLFALAQDELQPVLDEACRIVAEGLAMPLAKLMRLDPGRGDFLTVAGTGWRPGVVGVCRLGPGRESPAGFCIETGEAVVSNRLEQERRFAVPPVLAEHGVRSAVNVPVARDQLLEAAQRVMTIGAVHERLYQGGSVQEADAAAYLEGLVADLRRSMSDAAAGRAVELDVPPPPLRLPADQLTPLGLVAAELVTNALKYGRGRVRLAVRPVPGVPGGVEVACEDEGPGFPEDFDPRRSRGLGMRLVAALAKGGDPIRVDRAAPHARSAVTITPAA